MKDVVDSMQTMRTAMRLGLWVLLLAGVALVPGREALGQWNSLKRSIQPEVDIVEETADSLKLYHNVLSDTLLVTLEPAESAHIFGGVEWERGGNPYRVWVALPRFWDNPGLPRELWGAYFDDAFLDALRPPPEGREEYDAEPRLLVPSIVRDSSDSTQAPGDS